MKFTKENVERVFDKFMQGGDSLADLKESILNLVDTPEKVVVPKFVADVFSSELHFEYEIQESRNIPHVLSAAFSEVISNKNIKFLQWVKQYPDKYVMAVKYGYEVEKEPLYQVLLPHVTWSDERSELVTDYQKLMFDKTSEETILVHRQYVPVNNDYTCKLTESDIKEIDERYWPFAVPVND